MKRHKHKRTLSQPRMRHHQVVFAQNKIPEEQNIQVQRSRPVLHSCRAVAPKLKLDVQQRLDQIARSQICFNAHNRIQKPRLFGKSHRLG